MQKLDSVFHLQIAFNTFSHGLIVKLCTYLNFVTVSVDKMRQSQRVS